MSSKALFLGLAFGAFASRVHADVTARDSKPFVGVIVAVQRADLQARAAGRLDAIHVRVGQRVKAGQSLGAVDVALATNQLHTEASAMLVARAELERNGARVKLAEEQLARRARAESYVSREQLDAARRDLEVARAEFAMASAKVEQASARQEHARIQVEQARLTAPFDGIVAAVYGDAGTTVRAGTTVLRIASEELRVRFATPSHVPQLRKDERVSVTTASGARYEATVDAVAPEVDSKSGMVLMEARFSDATTMGHLKNGEIVDVTGSEQPKE